MSDAFEALDEFAALYHRAACGLLTMTPEGEITEVNNTLTEWTGYTRDQLVGSSFKQLLDVGGQLFYETRQLVVLKLQGEVREVALSFVCADGSRLPVLVNSVLAGAQTPVVHVAVFDVTGRQEYERELLHARRSAEASEARVKVLQDASIAFIGSGSDLELAQALTETARVAFTATATAVFIGQSAGSLQLIAGSYPLGDELSIVDAALATSTVVTRSLPANANGLTDSVLTALRAARLEGVAVAPLLSDGLPLGAIVSFFAREREFTASFIELQEALARQAAQVLARIRLQLQLEALALYDQLTGLASRKVLQEEVALGIVRAHDAELPLAVIFLDLDGFKAVNDRLGHSTGDFVLQQVASRLRASVRQGDVVGRFGGDEFVAICEGADQADALAIADRIRHAVNERIAELPDDLPIAASIGTVVYVPDPDRPATSDELLNLADDAMYRSKAAGKDRVTFASR